MLISKNNVSLKHRCFTFETRPLSIALDLPKQETATVFNILVKDWICKFGVPLELYYNKTRN